MKRIKGMYVWGSVKCEVDEVTDFVDQYKKGNARV
jgi:hypothetical protein